MERFHLFFDENKRAIVIEDHPDALDLAPYDRMATRARGMADALTAEFWLKAHGGVAIYADGRQVEVEPI
ncbi:hypothetical protein ATO7_12138 [Oceanococcus atlanticus]|uniref:Uncharacterized protein n=1 Tax=Oceanococcus atlanticus TaxID=1317117 RepID=A0A1Y1SBV1_9GAMM|nr:hypothetical protein [Oceanococcus atlanticus]ORE86043.1 hypothetical protein ATO7_12138 [Oceanococcus atlanticus]